LSGGDAGEIGIGDETNHRGSDPCRVVTAAPDLQLDCDRAVRCRGAGRVEFGTVVVEVAEKAHRS